MRVRVVRRRDQRGASLVEFSLLLPVFFMLVLGMFTGGQTYNQKLSITHAAREGARYGATVPMFQSFASGTWASNVQNVVVQRSSGELTAANVCVSLVSGNPPAVINPGGGFPQSNYTTNADGSPCYDDGSADPGSRVEIRINDTGKLEFLLFSMPVNLTAKGTAKFEAG